MYNIVTICGKEVLSDNVLAIADHVSLIEYKKEGINKNTIILYNARYKSLKCKGVCN